SDKYVHPTMAAYAAAVTGTRPAINVAALVGHSTLRIATMSDTSRTAERAVLARRAGEAGGVYTPHIRDEFARVMDSLDEAFATARRGKLPVVISHHKCAGPDNWGRTGEAL